MIRALRDRRLLQAGLCVALAGAATGAEACRCADLSRDALYSAADLVVLGTITAVRTGDEETRFGVEVEEALKGEPGEVLEVLTTGTCTYAVAPGERHLIYLETDPSTGPRTGLCSGNLAGAEAEAAAEDMEAATQ